MPAPQITLTSPLGEDLKFESMKLSEGLSTLGEMQLTLRSSKPDLQPEDLLGKPVTVTVELRNGQRYFNGYVTRFGAGRHQGRYFGYTAIVHPWLWFLGRTSDCRIFVRSDAKPRKPKKWPSSLCTGRPVIDHQVSFLVLARTIRSWKATCEDK